MSFAYMTALELKGLLAERSISPVELVEDTLSRQDALEPQINAFVNRTPEQALAAGARGGARDCRRRGGCDCGPSGLGQGSGAGRGRALDLRLPALREQRGRLRCAVGGADQASRRLHYRKVHHKRVRLQGGLRQPAQRDHPQSMGPDEDVRRLQWRRGRERRRRPHAVRARHRWRRLRAHPVCALRPLRHQGAVRPGADLPGLGSANPRPRGVDRAHGAGCRAPARCHGGPRPARCLRRRRAHAGFPRRLRCGRGGLAHRLEPDPWLRAARARGPLRCARPPPGASRRWAAPSSWSRMRSAPIRSSSGWRSSTAASAPS